MAAKKNLSSLVGGFIGKEQQPDNPQNDTATKTAAPTTIQPETTDIRKPGRPKTKQPEATTMATFKLPTALLREIKVAAAIDGTTQKDILVKALTAYLAHRNK